MLQLIRCLNLLLTGLIAGTLFGIRMGYDPRVLSGAAFVEQQQEAIRGLNVLMPLLGLIAILLTVLSAILQRRSSVMWKLLTLAAALLIFSGLVTRFGNQPINTLVMTWDKGRLPPGWDALRDNWWSFHCLRMMASLGAFCLIIGAGVIRYRRSE